MIQSMKVYRWSKRAQRRKWRMESESRGRLFLKTPEEKRRSAKDLLVSRVSSEVRNNFTMHFIIGNHLHAEWTRKWDHIQGFDQGFVCVSRLTAVSMTEGTLGDYPSHYLRDYSFHYQSMGSLSMAQRERERFHFQTEDDSVKNLNFVQSIWNQYTLRSRSRYSFSDVFLRLAICTDSFWRLEEQTICYRLDKKLKQDFCNQI